MFGLNASLYALGLRKLFDKMANDYCTKIEGRPHVVCDADISGCGLNDNCRFGEKCVNSLEAPNGYVCKDNSQYILSGI